MKIRIRGHRSAEEIALSHVAPEFEQKIELLLRLDALHDRRHPELARHVKAGGQNDPRC